MTVVVNVLLFQISWFACVLGSAKQLPWWGVFVSLAVMLFYVQTSANRAQALKLIVIALAIGLVFDAVPVQLNWVQFADMPLWSTALAPAWMLVLWGNLVTTLSSSLAWLQGKPWLAALFGAVGGPLAYGAGEKLGALQVLQTTPMIVYLALGWALIMPFLLYFNRPQAIVAEDQCAETGVV